MYKENDTPGPNGVPPGTQVGSIRESLSSVLATYRVNNAP